VPEYLYTHMPLKFFEGCQEGQNRFTLPNDEQAEKRCAWLTVGILRVVIPSGGGTCLVRPRKLVEMKPDGTNRVVRDFEAEGITGWESV
jgi:hypothetical protein